ncbi:four helix bundle protein [Reichenbachiella faecimaris]|uniref:Four helix bundle protein n=1 Tax=Reichenbachiella faecimaris TaxID=692418 RepID=A0A1W2GCC8_REIFA|nr:four helix bundle protein [Reichenbachiella faecimaris]SMD34317.1 four helix bundle protein [Reichenbachiella faecimaris]
MRDYTKYQVWTDAVEFTVKIYTLTKSFPSDEKYGLISQMRRASVSISSNIAEGASRTSEKEFSRFIEISLGSAFELKTHMIVAEKLAYLDKEVFDKTIPELNEICKQLNGLRNSLKK